MGGMQRVDGGKSRDNIKSIATFIFPSALNNQVVIRRVAGRVVLIMAGRGG